MYTPALLGIIFYLIATVYCEELSVVRKTYPEFIKLEDAIGIDGIKYQIGGNIPVFKKRSSDTDMNDYTVAVFYDEEDVFVEAVYILVGHNQANADIVTYYINWEQEISVDSIISRSGSRKLKSIECQTLTQVESQGISCMPIERIKRFRYTEDENIFTQWLPIVKYVPGEKSYPEFIKLVDAMAIDGLKYQIDRNIPVFKKRSSDTDMNDYNTVAVFYDEKEEHIEAVYVLLEHNQVNANSIPEYTYIDWKHQQEDELISVDSIISRSGSIKKLKSINCTQLFSWLISCLPIEKTMKYTYNKDENIIKTWEGTEIPSIEIYLKKFAIRNAILSNALYVTEQGLSITNMDKFFDYATGFTLPTETITIAVNNVKRTYSTYLPFTEFCSPARELIDQIEENTVFYKRVKLYSPGLALGIVDRHDMEAAKATLVSYEISEEKLVDAETKGDLWEKMMDIVRSMKNTKFQLFADNIMPDYENYWKRDRMLSIGEVEIGHLCETGW